MVNCELSKEIVQDVFSSCLSMGYTRKNSESWEELNLEPQILGLCAPIALSPPLVKIFQGSLKILQDLHEDL